MSTSDKFTNTLKKLESEIQMMDRGTDKPNDYSGLILFLKIYYGVTAFLVIVTTALILYFVRPAFLMHQKESKKDQIYVSKMIATTIIISLVILCILYCGLSLMRK